MIKKGFEKKRKTGSKKRGRLPRNKGIVFAQGTAFYSEKGPSSKAAKNILQRKKKKC